MLTQILELLNRFSSIYEDIVLDVTVVSVKTILLVPIRIFPVNVVPLSEVGVIVSQMLYLLNKASIMVEDSIFSQETIIFYFFGCK